MKNAIKVLALTLASLLPFGEAAVAGGGRAASDESTVYLQIIASHFPLYVMRTQSDGPRIMVPQLNLPAQSVIAVQVGFLAHQLELQDQSAELVNFNYAVPTSALDSEVYHSKDGWVCGARLVHVADDHARASDLQNFQNYCFQNTQWAQLAVSGNEREIQNALRVYQLRKDVTALSAMARISEDADLEKQFAPAEVQPLLSPLKNCAKGCLSGDSRRRGIDFRSSKGQIVLAVADGRVVGIDRRGKWATVVILHADQKLESFSGLIAAKTVSVKVGQSVKQGQALGRVIQHLHFELHRQGIARDPRSLL